MYVLDVHYMACVFLCAGADEPAEGGAPAALPLESVSVAAHPSVRPGGPVLRTSPAPGCEDHSPQ